MDHTLNDLIIVKHIKVNGQMFDNPVPRFEYAVKIGTWCILIDTERYADYFAALHDQQVEVEVGMQFGTLRDVGRVKVWQGELADAPSFVAKIEGSDPMQFVDFGNSR